MEADSVERLVVEIAEQMRHRFYGKYRGLVSDNDDPKKMGRIKAQVEEVLGPEVSPWALPCTPYAGEGSGQYTVPPVGGGVWIEFEAGDPSRPIWTGCWWKQDQAPVNESDVGKVPEMKIIRTESGLLLSMDDDGKTISVSDSDGRNILKIESQSGNVSLKGTSKAVIDAPAIEFVENATHPVVFGDNLLQYLTQLVTMIQTHTHPGEMALGVFPVTPMVPAQAFPMPQMSLLSNIVKSG